MGCNSTSRSGKPRIRIPTVEKYFLFYFLFLCQPWGPTQSPIQRVPGLFPVALTSSPISACTTSYKETSYLLTYLLTYLLIPRYRVLLEKLTGLQLVKKFPAFHGTRRFITAHTSVRHLSLSWVSPIQSIYPHPTSWRSILILSTHLHLGLLIGFMERILTYSTVQSPS